MRDHRPLTITTILTSKTQNSLQKIQQHASTLLHLDRTVKAVLPEEFHGWYRIANLRNNVLVLEVANASWLMRLRYAQPALLTTLRQQILPSLTAIDIRINPSLMQKAKNQIVTGTQANASSQTSARKNISPQSAKMLKEVALHSPKALRAALERLATLAGENDSATSK